MEAALQDENINNIVLHWSIARNRRTPPTLKPSNPSNLQLSVFLASHAPTLAPSNTLQPTPFQP